MTDRTATVSGRVSGAVRALLGTLRRRIVAGVTAATLALVCGGGAVYAATRDASGQYRTAVAERADVTQTLALTGQLAAAANRDVAFQVDGTVQSVLVELGQTVTAGQQLATLDTEELDAAVTDAEDRLAQAQQQLEDDLETQQHGGSSGSSSGGSSGGAAFDGSTSGAGPAGSGSGGSGPSASGSAGSGSGSSDRPSEGMDPTPTAEPEPTATPTPTAPATPSPGDGSGSDEASGDAGGDDGDTPSGSDDRDDAAVTAAVADVADAQQALLDQYELAATAQQKSAQSLTSAQDVCTPFLDATIAVDEPAPSEDDAADENAPSSESTDAEELQQQLADCQAAISGTQQLQQQTADEQSALTDRADALDGAVAALQKALGAVGGGSDADTSTDPDAEPDADVEPGAGTDPDAARASTSSDTGRSSTVVAVAAYHSASQPASAQTADVQSASVQTATGEQTPSASGGSGIVTAETILADRAAIDAAEATLAVAQRDRSLATLSSPIAGTVVSLGMAAGDAVTAGSGDTAVGVQAADGYIVELSVPLAQITGVQVGQTATASLSAFDAEYDGTVSAVGVQNVSDTSTPSYTVTVAVDAGDDQPRIGATTRVEISLATAEDVLTVPISALARDGSKASVTVLSDDDTTRTVTVKPGAVGSERVEITDGLSAGDRVVIADLTQPVGDEDASSSTGLSGLGGSGSTRGGSGGFQPPESFTPPSG
ncbi:HlyD family efflux transporter periplasmic adaptor subunit [Microbacterium sp. ARD32]|uniref:HlyD family efflux transporter periplasmic adaptor subunit n=1 Tax=Microbacterium sp. ARD32 TaxID=2962577 RepID=UPI0028818063|nr:HlyD family efflux transporter periplasmic adaptor subunit [Microbacterium sp. ARD32]MDT0156221.1 HlyD family efflux transporter periplasmic adaptor subunit [Microbacterium sp. ARD32]